MNRSWVGRVSTGVALVALGGGCAAFRGEEPERGAPIATRSGGGGVCATNNSLSEEQIAEQRPVHIEEMLNQIPGVSVARVGNGYSVHIRGTTGLTTGTEPLYMIDGMAVSGQRAGVLPVNPSDVECVEVLKEVAYTGAFGVRGANGVILITTRRMR